MRIKRDRVTPAHLLSLEFHSQWGNGSWWAAIEAVADVSFFASDRRLQDDLIKRLITWVVNFRVLSEYAPLLCAFMAVTVSFYCLQP